MRILQTTDWRHEINVINAHTRDTACAALLRANRIRMAIILGGESIQIEVDCHYILVVAVQSLLLLTTAPLGVLVWRDKRLDMRRLPMRP